MTSASSPTAASTPKPYTSRWDYGYTGGDSNGNLAGLEGKRVGIIGTGATAVQCVPHLGEHAEHLYVFQRTPSSIDVRGNKPTDDAWAAQLTPGWQQHRMTNFNVLVTGGFQDEDLVSDGWTDIIRNLATLGRPQAGEDITPEQAAARVELADFKKMEQMPTPTPQRTVQRLLPPTAPAAAKSCSSACFWAVHPSSQTTEALREANAPATLFQKRTSRARQIAGPQ